MITTDPQLARVRIGGAETGQVQLFTGPVPVSAQLLRFIDCVATINGARFAEYLSAAVICVFDFIPHFSSGYADDYA